MGWRPEQRGGQRSAGLAQQKWGVRRGAPWEWAVVSREMDPSGNPALASVELPPLADQKAPRELAKLRTLRRLARLHCRRSIPLD